MLEMDDDEREDSYFSVMRNEAYYEGMMKGLCESWCFMFREARTHKMKDLSIKIFDDDVHEELSKFYDKYGILSDDKMADHILKESEFLMGVW